MTPRRIHENKAKEAKDFFINHSPNNGTRDLRCRAVVFSSALFESRS